jgi:hypothetical protein
MNVYAYRYSSDGKTFYFFCGTMNSKNSFGGYGDDERFIASPFLSTLESTATDFDEAWAKFCTGQGHGPIWF